MRNKLEIGEALTLAAGFTAGAALVWLASSVRERLGAPGPVSDDILAQRARERIGDIASRPDEIAVQVEHGVVRVSGRAPARECDELLTSLLRIPGVSRVRSALARTNTDRV